MCTLVQYTGRQSQNIEVFHHIHPYNIHDDYGWLKKKIKKGSPTRGFSSHPYNIHDGYGWLKKKIKKGSPTRGRTNPWLAL